jgi:Fe-Mn family superoxide dismutase
MALTFPDLPYPLDALEPHMSRETLEFHHGRHHKAYVDKANELLVGSGLENLSLENIVKKSSGKLLNNAAQVWNHNFFWQCLSPEETMPQGALASAIDRHFGSLEDLKKEFTEKAAANFGSGWTWLVKHEGKLKVINTSNAANPLTRGGKALLTCDVWEHAYYIDYRNARPDYLEHFWKLVNWDFVEMNLVSTPRESSGVPGGRSRQRPAGASVSPARPR